MRGVWDPRVRARISSALLVVILAVLGMISVSMPASADPAPAAASAPPSVPALDETTKQLSDRIGVAERNMLELTERANELQGERVARASDVAAADAQVAGVTVARQQAVADFGAAETHVRELAVAAYKHNGASTMLDLMLSASNARSFGFGTEMVRRADVGEQRAADEARARRDDLSARLGDATDLRAEADANLASVASQFADTNAGLEQAITTIGNASDTLERHLPEVPHPGEAILGVSHLAAPQLLAWYQSTGSVPHVNVSISELIDDYLAEGAAEHVRGDIAFLQSIVETGYFSFPGSGQVGTPDNNFAGIGACDTCTHGDRFTDTREGVRAQIQLLHFYADPTMTQRRLAHPAIQELDHLGVKGCCATWYSLTGKWATAPTYGPVILALYQKVLDYTADHSVPQ
jgi:hypothetical protein